MLYFGKRLLNQFKRSLNSISVSPSLTVRIRQVQSNPAAWRVGAHCPFLHFILLDSYRLAKGSKMHSEWLLLQLRFTSSGPGCTGWPFSVTTPKRSRSCSSTGKRHYPLLFYFSWRTEGYDDPYSTGEWSKTYVPTCLSTPDQFHPVPASSCSRLTMLGFLLLHIIPL